MGPGSLPDPENDYVIRSRKGNLVDRSGALSVDGRSLVGIKRITRPDEAAESFDAAKDDFENAGIARRDVLGDSNRW